MDEILAVNPLSMSNAVSLLDGRAADVWNLLGEAATISEISIGLAKRYQLSREHISPDVETLVADLMTRGLIERAE